MAHGSTYEEALERNADLYQQLEQREKRGLILGFSSVGGVAFPKAQQQANIDQWNDFWGE